MRRRRRNRPSDRAGQSATPRTPWPSGSANGPGRRSVCGVRYGTPSLPCCAGRGRCSLPAAASPAAAELLRVAAAVESADSDADAWQMWCAATGLWSARHLSGVAGRAGVPARTSFWTAPASRWTSRCVSAAPSRSKGRPAQVPNRRDGSPCGAGGRRQAAGSRRSAERALAARSGDVPRRLVTCHQPRRRPPIVWDLLTCRAPQLHPADDGIRTSSHRGRPMDRARVPAPPECPSAVLSHAGGTRRLRELEDRGDAGMTSEATGLTTRADAQDTFVALLTTPLVSARVDAARFGAVLQHRTQLTEWAGEARLPAGDQPEAWRGCTATRWDRSEPPLPPAWDPPSAQGPRAHGADRRGLRGHRHDDDRPGPVGRRAGTVRIAWCAHHALQPGSPSRTPGVHPRARPARRAGHPAAPHLGRGAASPVGGGRDGSRRRIRDRPGRAAPVHRPVHGRAGLPAAKTRPTMPARRPKGAPTARTATRSQRMLRGRSSRTPPCSTPICTRSTPSTPAASDHGSPGTPPT